jgi:hypothetical protein
MHSKDVFTDHERAVLADKAVKRLIADAEAKRLPESRELVAAITACICETESSQLRELNFLLEQQEPGRTFQTRTK